MGTMERLARDDGLLEAAGPVIGRLQEFLSGSGFFAVLADAGGRILTVTGDGGAIPGDLGTGIVPGALLDEGNAGTAAVALALARGSPVQLSGAGPAGGTPDGTARRWTCSGAPVRDAEGRMTGALGLTGDSSAAGAHTLGMVVAAADAIERSIVLNARNAALARSNRFVETLLDSITAGIVSVDLEGRILSVNRQALAMLCMEKEEFSARGIVPVLPAWPDVRAASLARRELVSEDIPVTSRSPRPFFNLASYPILDEGGEPRAVILVFKDVRKVRKHANEILGRRALYTFDKIIGASKGLLDAVEFAKKVADSRSTILLTGESGTGKEIFAQAIQNASSRRDEPFVVINCGAIPRTLIESELFGYADGAFTGAKRGGHPGKFEIADGGTIFLDEIGEMPLDMQTRLLRVIEEGIVTRVGDSRNLPVDVRIIAASNTDLGAEVARGNFRVDLYYRLNVLPISIPPLRERREDIPLLIAHYMDRISRRINRRPVAIDPGYMDALVRRPWPGNVRELENFIELVINTERLPPLDAPEAGGASGGDGSAPPSLEESGRELIRRTLAACGDNVALAARRLGIGRTTIYRKLGPRPGSMNGK